VAALRATYSPGIAGIAVVSTSSGAYCISATVEGSTWFKAGPDEPITRTACA